jgi:hypothetical protein
MGRLLIEQPFVISIRPEGDRHATIELMTSARRRDATGSLIAAAGDFYRHTCRFPVISNRFSGTPLNDRISKLGFRRSG